MSVAKAGYNFSRLNDVHARWLLTENSNKGLCTAGFDDALSKPSEYLTACDNNSTGGIVRAATVINKINDDMSTKVHFQVLVGDEFQGTPLFSFRNLGNDHTYGWSTEAAKSLKTYTDRESNLDQYLTTIGNHEFDSGVVSLAHYLEDINTLGYNTVCMNCVFDKDDVCLNDSELIKDVPNASDYVVPFKAFAVFSVDGVEQVEDISPSDKSSYTLDDPTVGGSEDFSTVAFVGMTPPNIHQLAKVPSECEVRDYDSSNYLTQLKELLDQVDHLWFMSHMGYEDDVVFANWLNANLDAASVAKIQGITGGHSHSVPCGTIPAAYTSFDSLSVVNSDDGNVRIYKEVVDSVQNSTVDVGCEYIAADQYSNLGGSLEGVTETPGQGAYHINHPSTQKAANGEINVYHSGMHSNMIATAIVDDNLDITDFLTPLDARVSTSQPSATYDYDDNASLFKEAFPELNRAKTKSVATITKDDAPIDWPRSCKGTDDLGGHWSSITGNLQYSFGCSSGHMMANASMYTSYHMGQHMENESGANFDNASNTPHVSMFNGGGVRGVLPGDTALYDLMEVFPFADEPIVIEVTGENLMTNLAHGLFGFKGLQVAGARAWVNRDWDFPALDAALTTLADEENFSRDAIFCDATNARKADHGFSRDGDDILKARTHRATTRSSKTAKADAAFKLVTASGVTLQYNTCLAPALKGYVASSPPATLPDAFQLAAHYADECWKTIDPTDKYLITTTTFMANGGDWYCFDYNEDDMYALLVTQYADADVEVLAALPQIYSKYVDNTWQPLIADHIVKSSKEMIVGMAISFFAAALFY